MTSDVVNILSSIPSDRVDYIILYFTSAAFKPNTNAIAIRTGNIKEQLNNQNVTIYKYAGIDKYNDGGVSFTSPKVIHRNEDGEYQAQYSYSIPPLDKDRNQRIWPAFKTAYRLQRLFPGRRYCGWNLLFLMGQRPPWQLCCEEYCRRQGTGFTSPIG